MFETSALFSFFLAFALLYGARESRFPVRHFSSVKFRPSRAVILGLRVLSATIALLGVYLWAVRGGVTAALLVGLSGLCVSASFFVLMAPLWPRALWLAVAASFVALAVLSSTSVYG